ncbi:MAG: hypothetical protein QOH58_3417, partial [Thermoleophilaceae bacterium]|nr:hypothetical protein [Thermoleophilaceae bacterium]
MTLGQYALGILLLAAVIVPLALGARAIRMRLLPGWNGTPAAVADAVIALSLGIAVAELLGLVGAFARIPVVLGCAAAGAGAWLLARRRAPEEAASPRDSLKPAMPQRGAGGASPQDSLKPAMRQPGAEAASPRDSLKPAMPQRGAGGASPQDSLKPAMPQPGA